MTERAPRSPTTERKGAHLTRQERRARKQRVLAQKRPSKVRSLADAVVVKEEDVVRVESSIDPRDVRP